MPTYRLTEAAQSDIVEILAWSEAQFGDVARCRYQQLVAAALRDVAAEPERPGSVARPELGPGVRSWHLRESRDRARVVGAAVRRPRHFLIYKAIDAETVVIGRVLHDAMELRRHFPSASDDLSG